MKKMLLSIGFGTLAVLAGTICHRVAPGLGLVLMPMFWPLAVLAAKVPLRYSLATAFVVPFVSFLLTGMPALPLVVAFKFVVLTGLAAFLFRRVLSRVHS